MLTFVYLIIISIKNIHVWYVKKKTFRLIFLWYREKKDFFVRTL